MTAQYITEQCCPAALTTSHNNNILDTPQHCSPLAKLPGIFIAGLALFDYAPIQKFSIFLYHGAIIKIDAPETVIRVTALLQILRNHPDRSAGIFMRPKALRKFLRIMPYLVKTRAINFSNRTIQINT